MTQDPHSTQSDVLLQHRSLDDFVCVRHDVGYGKSEILIPLKNWGPSVALITHEAHRSDLARRLRKTPADGLKTAAQAAAKLGCSTKTLKGHVKAGALKYVTLGHGRVRKRRMFTDADLEEFIANQTRKDQPACPSSRTPARHSGASTSNAKVIAFSGQPKPGPGGKPKR